MLERPWLEGDGQMLAVGLHVVPEGLPKAGQEGRRGRRDFRLRHTGGERVGRPLNTRNRTPVECARDKPFVLPRECIEKPLPGLASMKLTYDPEAGAACISLVPFKPGMSKATVPVDIDGHAFAFDFDAEGRLVSL